MNECPVCGDQLDGDALYVARHVWSWHVTHRSNVTDVPPVLHDPVTMCWCCIFTLNFEDWLRHVGDQTKVQAHWLEYSLGLAKPFNPFGDVPFTRKVF